jgi:hypothetical protein
VQNRHDEACGWAGRTATSRSITRRVAPSYAAPSLPGRGGPYCPPHFSLVNGRIRVSTKFPRYCGSGNYLHAHMAASHQQPVAQSARHPSPHTSVRRRAFTHYCHFVFFLPYSGEDFVMPTARAAIRRGGGLRSSPRDVVAVFTRCAR